MKERKLEITIFQLIVHSISCISLGIAITVLLIDLFK